MATRRTRTVRTQTYAAKAWMFKLSFWLVVIVGIAIAVSAILNYVFNDVAWARHMASWVKSLCFAIGMFIPVIMSYQVARYKSTGWFIVWLIAVILVVVGLVFSILGHI